MARTSKKTAVKKAEAAEEVKVVTAETIEAETVAPAVEEKKAAPKKTTARKTTAKKETEVAEKTTTTKKATTKKATETVYVQYAGNEYDVADIIEKAKAAYDGKKAIKEVKVYVKPEEGKAYYVINEDERGSVAL